MRNALWKLFAFKYLNLFVMGIITKSVNFLSTTTRQRENDSIEGSDNSKTKQTTTKKKEWLEEIGLVLGPGLSSGSAMNL